METVDEPSSSEVVVPASSVEKGAAEKEVGDENGAAEKEVGDAENGASRTEEAPIRGGVRRRLPESLRPVTRSRSIVTPTTSLHTGIELVLTVGKMLILEGVREAIASEGFTPPAPIASRRAKRKNVSSSVRDRAAGVRAKLIAFGQTPPPNTIDDSDMDVDEDDMDDDIEEPCQDDVESDGEGLADHLVSIDPISSPRVSSPTVLHMPTDDPSYMDMPPVVDSGCGPSDTDVPTQEAPTPSDTAAPPTPSDTAAPPTAPTPSVPAQEAPWMPGGPRTSFLLTSYETHIARAIWELTPTDPLPLGIERLLPPLPRARRRRRRGGGEEVVDAGEEVVGGDEAVDDERVGDDGVAVGEGAVPAVVVPKPRGPGIGNGDLCCKVLKIHTHAPYTTDLETFIRPGPDSWFGFVELSGLSGLRFLGTGAIDRVLVSAFVERWHPETNSFHFHWGEITITSHDVNKILVLPIEGRMPKSSMQDSDVRQRIAEGLGVELTQVQSWYSNGGIPLLYLHTRLKQWMQMDQRDESLIATYYMLLLLGSTVLVDKSTHAVKYKWVALLFDHSFTGRCAWGVGVLAFLYRNLGEASRRNAAGMASCGILLRAWIWAYFPHFRGHSLFDPASMMHGAAAIRDGEEVPQGSSKYRLTCIRRMLDVIRYEEVKWFPFPEVSFDRPDYAPSLFRGIIQCMDIQEAYLSDRVLRQFRHVQGVPMDPPIPTKVNRPKVLKHYTVQYDSSLLNSWDEEPRSLIDIVQPRATFYWAVSDDYFDWLDQVSHVLVDPRSPKQDRPSGVIHPLPHVDTLARHQLAVGEIQQFLDTADNRSLADTLVVMRHLLNILTTTAPPMAPPPPRAPHLFRDSVHEHGSGSGSDIHPDSTETHPFTKTPNEGHPSTETPNKGHPSTNTPNEGHPSTETHPPAQSQPTGQSQPPIESQLLTETHLHAQSQLTSQSQPPIESQLREKRT